MPRQAAPVTPQVHAVVTPWTCGTFQHDLCSLPAQSRRDLWRKNKGQINTSALPHAFHIGPARIIRGDVLVALHTVYAAKKLLLRPFHEVPSLDLFG